ncbi:hypothetical protein AKJ41_04440 [candidate division MSBL1 archaeon SCGC-AAA259O05]|uniref:Uncharacterized protein n=1 Tax=candidate division MSBL1 archaeon SCGC-AAA259O05 TaxID=1698271 RepID=A0A133V0T6_9EURY|nr:hypothetical protein AKJ41_04440 [candidate division MSBL1 archaeon SCGC-AAA259O05]
MFFEDQEKDKLKRVKRFFDEKLREETPPIREKNDPAEAKKYNYRVQSEPLAKFFTEGLGTESGDSQKKVP